MARILVIVLLLVLLLLQYQLWFARNGSVMQTWRLHRVIAAQNAINNGIKEQNRILTANVAALKNGSAAVENEARKDLGMIKKGEVFYRVVP